MFWCYLSFSLEDQLISVHNPKIVPLLDLTIERVDPLLSQFLWKISEENPSLDPLKINIIYSFSGIYVYNFSLKFFYSSIIESKHYCLSVSNKINSLSQNFFYYKIYVAVLKVSIIILELKDFSSIILSNLFKQSCKL